MVCPTCRMFSRLVLGLHKRGYLGYVFLDYTNGGTWAMYSWTSTIDGSTRSSRCVLGQVYRQQPMRTRTGLVFVGQNVSGRRQVGCTHVMHGRSRMAIDPRIPICNAGTEHVGLSPTRKTLLAPNAKGNVSCSARRIKGELHPTKNSF